MPRIKSPISIIEMNYNLRYDPDKQRYFLNCIRGAKNHGFYGSYVQDFLEKVDILLSGHRELTEPQADYLADLYDRYSE